METVRKHDGSVRNIDMSAITLAEAFAKKDSEIERLKIALVDAGDVISYKSSVTLEKDAEIERLKRQLQHEGVTVIGYIGGAYREIIREHEERIDRLVFKLSEAQELITELCDAIERVNYSWPNDYDTDLLQRAREATR